MKKDFLKIIQISDMHLFGDRKGVLLGVNTNDSFQAVVDLIRAEKNDIDLILLTGDLAQDGSFEAYKRIADILQIFNVPIYFIPGNHDNDNVMNKAYPDKSVLADKQIVFKDWQIILLDSQKKDAIEGWFEAPQLAYLEECLSAHPKQHALITFHHQPVPVGSKWLDNHGIKNAQKFWEIVAKHPQVNTVLFGHVHQEFYQLFNRVKCYAVPSTCFQFMRKRDDFALENLNPGYRWLHLYKDGRIETDVKRTQKYIGKFEKDAKGY